MALQNGGISESGTEMGTGAALESPQERLLPSHAWQVHHTDWFSV